MKMLMDRWTGERLGLNILFVLDELCVLYLVWYFSSADLNHSDKIPNFAGPPLVFTIPALNSS